MSFIHLHVHSQYSFLDGASTLDRLLEKAQALNMPALALTDHNRLTGAIRFYDKAMKLGIKPITGSEVTLEGGYHLTLLCKNMTGYSNLCRLLTESVKQRQKPAGDKSYAAKIQWRSDSSERLQ
jgi:error-prone DNA polymerase